MGRSKLGISRIYSLVLLVAVCLLVLLFAWFILGWLFGSSSEVSVVPPKVDLVPSLTGDETPGDDGLHDKSTVTTISLGFGLDGEVTTETTTETTGIDKEGHTVATTETKTGLAAETEAQSMMGSISDMLGGAGLGSLLGLGAPQRTAEQEAMSELVGSLLGGLPTASERAMARHVPKRRNGPLDELAKVLGAVPIGIIPIDMGHVHTHGHSHTHRLDKSSGSASESIQRAAGTKRPTATVDVIPEAKRPSQAAR